MKKLNLTFLLLLMCTLMASASDRTASQMAAIAQQKLSAATAEAKGFGNQYHLQTVKCVLENPCYNVYNAQDGAGFVIVSKDDRIEPVIGYSLTNHYDADNVPSGLAWYLSNVKTSIETDAAAIVKRQAAKAKQYTVVAPFVTTKWGQGDPFNRKAPKIGNDAAPAGCMAIAMAQCVNYEQYPASVKFSGTYTVQGGTGSTSVSFDNSFTYPFDNVYSTSTGLRAGNMVATFVQACGVAAEMEYTSGGSGAYAEVAATGLINDFTYPNTAIKFFEREFYNDSEWDTMIYNELQRGYPIIYCGADTKNGGHAFVANGINEDGLLYINWGWDGECDGYYNMDLMNPSITYGTTTESFQFSESQNILMGFHPTALATDHIQSIFGTATPYSFAYDNAKDSLSITFTSAIYNYTPNKFSGRFCFRYEDTTAGTTDYDDLLEEKDTIDALTGFKAQSFGFPTDEFKAGHHYRIAVVTKDTRESDWQLVRTAGGPIYYDIDVDANGKVTISNTPIYTGIKQVSVSAAATDKVVNPNVYTIDGRNVGRSLDSQGHGIYIQNGKKILK
jgi:hypothetical protein